MNEMQKYKRPNGPVSSIDTVTTDNDIIPVGYNTDINGYSAADSFYTFYQNANITGKRLEKGLTDDYFESLAIELSTTKTFANRARFLINMAVMAYNDNVLAAINKIITDNKINISSDINAITLEDLDKELLTYISRIDNYIVGFITPKVSFDIASALSSSLDNAFFSKNMPLVYELGQCNVINASYTSQVRFCIHIGNIISTLINECNQIYGRLIALNQVELDQD